MTVARPRAKKPHQAYEIGRVMRLYDVLAEDLAVRSGRKRSDPITDELAAATLLSVAERIAARTTEEI